MTARVLVVDDILSNVKLLEAKLTAEYFEVVTAFSGQEALDRMEEHEPDIVLLDVMMPGMDGFEVCRRIKSNPKSAHVPVVMVTALDQPADRVAGLEAGADDFLTKPVDDAALFARVRSLVRLKMMTDELRMREATGQNMGLIDPAESLIEADLAGRILIIEDRPESVAWFECRAGAAARSLRRRRLRGSGGARARRRLRSDRRQPGPARLRRPAAVLAAALAAGRAQRADPGRVSATATAASSPRRWRWASTII